MATEQHPPVPPIPLPPDAAATAPDTAPEPVGAPAESAPAESAIAGEARPNPYATQATPAASPYAAPVATPAATPVAVPDPYQSAQVQAPQPQPPQYQAGQYPPAQYQPAPYMQPGPLSGLSIASMIIGLVSLFFSLVGSGLLPGIAAVITGHIAARRQPHAKGFWLTGLITGYVSIGIGLIVVAFFAFIIIVGASSGWS